MARNKYDIDETLEQSFDFSKLGRALVYVKPYAKKMLFVKVGHTDTEIFFVVPTIKNRFAKIRKSSH